MIVVIALVGSLSGTHGFPVTIGDVPLITFDAILILVIAAGLSGEGIEVPGRRIGVGALIDNWAIPHYVG